QPQRRRGAGARGVSAGRRAAGGAGRGLFYAQGAPLAGPALHGEVLWLRGARGLRSPRGGDSAACGARRGLGGAGRAFPASSHPRVIMGSAGVGALIRAVFPVYTCAIPGETVGKAETPHGNVRTEIPGT